MDERQAQHDRQARHDRQAQDRQRGDALRGAHGSGAPQAGSGDQGRMPGPPGAGLAPPGGGLGPTYRQRPARPPLRDLPPPPRVEPDRPVLPDRILLESRQDLTRRILARFPAAGTVLLGLWIVLVVTLLLALAPTLWLFSPLLLLAGGVPLRQFLSVAGLSPEGLVIAALVPLLGVALSLAMVPLASIVIGRMDPRRHLTEAGFQREVARRASWVMVMPAVVLLALLVLGIACQVPLPWRDLSYGLLSGLAVAGGAIWSAQLILTRVLAAPRLLGIPDVRTLVLQTASDPEARARTARRLQAQDRRHLPPTGFEPDAAVLGRAVLVTGRGALLWMLPALVLIAWLFFLCADLVVVLPRMVDSALTPVRSRLPWQTYLVGGTVALLLAGALAIAPLIAIALSRSERAKVSDLRTAPTWAERARTNPWERRVVLLSTVICGVSGLGAIVLVAAVLGLIDGLGAIGWTWIVLDLVVLLPLGTIGAGLALREGLRDIVYGPAGRYMRRRSPWSLIAPELGTRTELADDPTVRARMRSAGGSSPSGPRGSGASRPEAGSTGAFGLPAIPGADGGNPLHVAPSPDGGLPDFSADSQSTWDEVDPHWSRGADTRRHPIPGDVEDVRER